MPYRIRWEGHGIYERFFGVLTLEDYYASHREWTGDIRCKSLRYVLVDCLEAHLAPQVTSADVKTYSKTEQLEYYSSPDIVYAVVATDERIREQTVYFKSLLRSVHPVGVFATVEEARAWIVSNPRRGGAGA